MIFGGLLGKGWGGVGGEVDEFEVIILCIYVVVGRNVFQFYESFFDENEFSDEMKFLYRINMNVI